jgi:hypothetical protein
MKHSKKSKKVAGLGLAAGLLAGAGAGFVLEMSGSAGASGTGVTAAVSALSPSGTDGTDSTDTRAADHAARLQEVLQPLIDDNTLTQEQVDKIIAALEAARPEGGPGGRGGFGPRLEVVATTLGITADEVRTALQDGTTLADLAAAHGKTAQDVVDALVAELKAHLDEEVAAGEHTQAEADARLADATTRITEMVNNGPPADGRGMGGPGMHGPRGERPFDDSDDATTGS